MSDCSMPSADRPSANGPPAAGGHERSVLITGASSGIGRSIAALFAARGWRVVGTSRDPDRLGPAPRLAGVDYLRWEQGEPGAAGDLADAAGPVDVLVNNAGQTQRGPLEHIDQASLEQLFRVNVLGPAALTQALLPGMRARGGGHVVFVGSLMAEFPVPFHSTYAASKAALRALAAALRLEVAPFGIAVTLVEPGYIRSEIRASRRWHTVPDSPYADRLARVVSAVDAAHESAGDPDLVARRVWALAQSSRPPSVRAVGGGGPAYLLARRILPDRMVERIVARRYRLSGGGAGRRGVDRGRDDHLRARFCRPGGG
jgi:short-subunit dehydrogenase